MKGRIFGIAAFLLLLVTAACGGTKNTAASANMPVATPVAFAEPMPGARLVAQVIENGDPFDTGTDKVINDGKDLFGIMVQIAPNSKVIPLAKKLANGESVRAFPYLVVNQDGNLNVWDMPNCGVYSWNDNGVQRTIELFEGEVSNASEVLPYNFWEATCVQGKIRILDVQASPDCSADSIEWLDDGLWSCKTASGTLMQTTGAPAPMWPQGQPAGQ